MGVPRPNGFRTSFIFPLNMMIFGGYTTHKFSQISSTASQPKSGKNSCCYFSPRKIAT
jgi:hypothetical protein